MPANDQKISTLTGAFWAARVGFGLVFLLNVQCAVEFIISPEAFLEAYELTGIGGETAIRGLGIAFLMWNVTYPLFIVAPDRFPYLSWIIVAQQLIGLIGESLLRFHLPAGHGLLAQSIDRFIGFDGLGLVVLLGCSIALAVALRKRSKKLT